MAKKTVAELLADAKRRRNKIQKVAIKKVKEDMPGSRLGTGRAAFPLAEGIIGIENLLMDYALQRIADEMGQVEISHGRKSKPITLEEIVQPPVIRPPQPKTPPTRTDPQLVNDEIMRIELANANGKARKKNGQFKKGWDQRRVMRFAQKECTKERERLGLCKRKSTRKGQRRKTARRAYER